jgi:hypothetical protein
MWPIGGLLRPGRGPVARRRRDYELRRSPSPAPRTNAPRRSPAFRDRPLAAIRDRRRSGPADGAHYHDQTDAPVDEILASFGPLAGGAAAAEEWQAPEQALRLGGILRDGVYVLPLSARCAGGGGTARLFVAGETSMSARARSPPRPRHPPSRALVRGVGEPTRPGAPDRLPD